MEHYTPTAGRKAGQRIYAFPNGLGASVIADGYGRESGLYELAVLDADGHVTYATPITSNVIGWLTEEEVQEHLNAIASFTPEEIREQREAEGLLADWKFEVDSNGTLLGFEEWKAVRSA